MSKVQSYIICLKYPFMILKWSKGYFYIPQYVSRFRSSQILVIPLVCSKGFTTHHGRIRRPTPSHSSRIASGKPSSPSKLTKGLRSRTVKLVQSDIKSNGNSVTPENTEKSIDVRPVQTDRNFIGSVATRVKGERSISVRDVQHVRNPFPMELTLDKGLRSMDVGEEHRSTINSCDLGKRRKIYSCEG